MLAFKFTLKDRGPHLDGQKSRLTQIWDIHIDTSLFLWNPNCRQRRVCFRMSKRGPSGLKWSAVTLLLYQTQSVGELIKALRVRARMHEHCLAVMDGFKFWRYYFPSFLETNWTFIAYILKIIQSSGEADVSFIEAHKEVRSHRINFPVLLLPQDDVWKMPAPLNWFRNEFITWGV